MMHLKGIKIRRSSYLRVARSFLKVCCVLAPTFLLVGCATKMHPLTDLELDNSAEEDHFRMFVEGERLNGDLSLEEAIARALKYNLDKRTKVLEHALALKQTKLDEYSLLPSLVAKGNYSDRSEFSASNSKDRGDGPPPSSGFSYSSDRTIFKGDLTLSWSVLDFGVSYYNARQNADRALIINERRRKVVHNLVREVQFAFWRMVAAQKLSDRVGVAIKRGELALIDSETVEKEKLRKPSEMLMYQKRLLQNIRKLETVNQQLSSAQIELAALINIPPGTYFKVLVPNTDKLAIPKWAIPLDKMEMLAFHKNPDIREKLYQGRISLDDAKRSLLALLPGIDLSGGRNSDSNSFQDVNRWFAWSNTLSLNVLKAFSIPDQMKHNEAKETLIDAQRLSLRMALLAQVHLANKQYMNSVSQFKRADKLYMIDKRLSSQVTKRQESDLQSLLDRISQETAAIDSELRRYETYSNVISSIAQIHSTLGIKILADPRAKTNSKLLAQSIEKGMGDWMSGYAIASELRKLRTFKSQKKGLEAKIEKRLGLKGILEKTKKLLKFKKNDPKDKLVHSSQTGHQNRESSANIHRTLLGSQNKTKQQVRKKSSSSGMISGGVSVLLNQTSTGGGLIKAEILCNPIKKVQKSGKWIEILAENTRQQKIKGWLHEIYFDKLTLQCAEKRLVLRF